MLLLPPRTGWRAGSGGAGPGAMRFLVLGGTHVLGRYAATAAPERGHEVATSTRGVSGPPPDGVHALTGDRDDRGALPASCRAGRRSASSTPRARALGLTQPSGARDAGRHLGLAAGHPAPAAAPHGLPGPGLPADREAALLASR